jgi:hypothetical protein
MASVLLVDDDMGRLGSLGVAIAAEGYMGTTRLPRRACVPAVRSVASLYSARLRGIPLALMECAGEVLICKAGFGARSDYQALLTEV